MRFPETGFEPFSSVYDRNAAAPSSSYLSANASVATMLKPFRELRHEDIGVHALVGEDHRGRDAEEADVEITGRERLHGGGAGRELRRREFRVEFVV